LKLTQQYQKVSGTLGAAKVEGKLNGDQITLTTVGAAAKQTYAGKVAGNQIQGTANGSGAWTATKR
ncbi:MAG TPA: hypothetical protein VFJ02_02385, partial [Vicinamibacterales bacterium]|nr:hypothetical protein [Vicinamibacterales bacterium]